MSKIEVAEGTNIAIGFPGQGAHDPLKMARLIREFPLALTLVQNAEDTLNRPLLGLLTDPDYEKKLIEQRDTGDETKEIKLTRDNQVKLYIGEGVLWLISEEEGVAPSPEDFEVERYFFGASAGEYAALMAAGAYDFSSGVKLINTRGEEMHSASIINPGTMLVASNLPFSEGKKLAKMFPGVDAVNDNPGFQTVFAGAVDQIAALGEYIRLERKEVKLDDPGVEEPAHTWHMAPAIDGLKRALSATKIENPREKFMSNRARLISKSRSVRVHLPQQLVRGVLLTRSANNLRNKYGVTTFIDAGLRRTLSSQMRKHFRKTVGVEAIVDYLLPEK